MTTTPFLITTDINGTPDYGLSFNSIKYCTTLVTGVEQTQTLPANPSATYPFWKIVFNYTGGEDIFVALNNTATVPGSSFAVTNSEQNPAVRYASPGDVIHMILGTAGPVYTTFIIKPSTGG